MIVGKSRPALTANESLGSVLCGFFAVLSHTVTGHPLRAVVMLCSLLLTLSQGGPGFLCKHGVVIAAVEQAELETAGGSDC